MNVLNVKPKNIRKVFEARYRECAKGVDETKDGGEYEGENSDYWNGALSSAAWASSVVDRFIEEMGLCVRCCIVPSAKYGNVCRECIDKE